MAEPPSRAHAVVTDLVARKTRADPARVLPTARLIDFGIDSVKGLELVVDLEQAFGIEISDRDLVELRTVGDLIGHVERCAAARPAP